MRIDGRVKSLSYRLTDSLGVATQFRETRVMRVHGKYFGIPNGLKGRGTSGGPARRVCPDGSSAGVSVSVRHRPADETKYC